MTTRCRIPGCQYEGECRGSTYYGGECGWLSCGRKLCGPHADELRRAWRLVGKHKEATT